MDVTEKPLLDFECGPEPDLMERWCNKKPLQHNTLKLNQFYDYSSF